jgi:TonB-dependent Receptor Plug Domain
MPEGMEIQGSLADDRVSTLLPDDWKPTPADPVTTAPILTQGKLLPPDARLGRITATFNERFRALAPVLFVHTDKPFYATGDRVWLSAYLLDAGSNRRLAGETAIHVDLLTATGKRVLHQWLRVEDGRTAGDFRLSDSLASGTYRLRAYTDEDDGQRRPAFERSIAIYNLVQATGPKAADTARKPADIQFLPEGGRWVAGVSARLGIKVVGPDGRGVLATGRIVNKEGVEVCRFATSPLGMGSVVMTPLSRQVYVAEVEVGNIRQVVPIPPFEGKGLTLSVDAVSDTNRLFMSITGGRRLDLDSVYVLVQQQGRLVDQRKIQLQNGAAQVSLSTALLPPGLNQITLYDDAARAQAERLVFLPPRVPPIRVVLSVNKTRYLPRDQAILSVTLNDDGIPAIAALSASITDAEQVPDDTAAATINTHLLLTGELRGKVEQPNGYLANNSAVSRRAVDDLLLTQGWRRVSGTPATELLGGVSLMGRVLNAKNQPMAGAQVVVASNIANKAFVRSAGADEQGRFRLAGLDIADTVKLVVQIADRQLKNLPAKDARVVVEGPGLSWEQDTTQASPDWAAWQMQLSAARIRQDGDAEFYRDKTVKLLKEVTVRARKLDERPNDSGRMSLHSGADATLLFDDRSPRFANLYEMIRGRLAGVNVSQNMTTGEYSVIVRGVGSLESSTQPLFLMDGRPVMNTDGVGLLAFNPEDIERVEVLKNAGTVGIYGVRGGSGVIAFYTKRFRPGELPAQSKANSTMLSLIGYPSLRREFYVPRYESRTDENQPADSARIDRRDVLYWKPVGQTDSQGHSQLIVPLSDVVRTMRVVIQGVTSDGRPVVGKALFQVQ